MFKDALDQLENPEDEAMLAIVNKDWSPGLVGLVAGKLVSEFHRPAFVVGHAGGKFVGSGRGVSGFDVTKALKAADEHLDSYGGHPQACGFSTKTREDVEAALKVMRGYVEEHIPEESLRPILEVDMELPLEAINWNLYEDLQSFRPFGEGNPKPLFASKGVSVMSTDTVGQDGKHLRLAVQSPNGKIWKAIGFGFGDWGERLSLGDEVDIAYHIGVNEWNGNRTIQLKLKDIKLHETSEETYEQEEA
jgi:single-stranded-DNA-specific exonuclease